MMVPHVKKCLLSVRIDHELPNPNIPRLCTNDVHILFFNILEYLTKQWGRRYRND